VLHSLPAPTDETRYAVQLLEGAPDELRVAFFTWRTALIGRYDIFHVHWPEFLLRDRKRWKSWARKVAMLTLLTRLRITRRPVVRTLHNVEPHERGGAFERFVERRVERETDLFIRLNATTPFPDHARTATILHGHYRDRYARYEVPPTATGRVLFFGLIRPYKGVVELIDQFHKLDDPELSLAIVGSPSTDELRAQITSASATDPRIRSELRFVDDAVLAREIGESELVVLPYHEMHNSGALLLALSLDRPVLAPRSPANEAINQEVGPGWVIQYDGPLSPEHITGAFVIARENKELSRVPRLEGRSWESVGQQHLDAYRQLLGGERDERARG
jgi:beta-1,4-mannosyltransferase